MDIASIVTKVPQWMDLIGLILTGVVLLATVLVRVAEMMTSIAPKAVDPDHVVKAKAIVNQAGEWLAKILHYFPTLLKNPKTQQMENLIAKLQVTGVAEVVTAATVVEVKSAAPDVPAAPAADVSQAAAITAQDMKANGPTT